MDGFSPRESVIVLGATNRPEVLDQALLRPGRFDRRVVVQPPDRAGREAILRVHTRSVPLAADVDLGAVAASTPGMVGADLANLANEAALLAARRDHEKVARQDLTDALERIVLGAARKVMISEDDRRRTAYHEAGHAIVGHAHAGRRPGPQGLDHPPRPGARGHLLGARRRPLQLRRAPPAAQIKVALGGRTAEEVVFGDLTTGAESDIQQLTRIARGMVGRWGMSPAIGPIAVLPPTARARCSRASSETSADDPAAGRRARSAASSRPRTPRRPSRCSSTAPTSTRCRPLLEHETLDEAEAYAAAGLRASAPASRVELAAGARASQRAARLGPQSPRRVIRASASWHSTTRCLTGSESGRSWTRSQVRSATSRAFSGVARLP